VARTPNGVRATTIFHRHRPACAADETGCASEGALNGGRESVLRAKEIVAGDLGGEVRAEDATATAASVSGDSNTPVGDISTLLNPDSALGEIVTAFDPNAVADITSLMSGDLASNASGWAVDLFSLF
jgi:hypothetical protein